MQLVYNWHITERCNYSCHYCFSKWDLGKEIWNSDECVDVILHEISMSNQVEKLKSLLVNNPVPRLNFAGGEPLLIGQRITEIAKKATDKYGIQCSIITNGSLLHKNYSIIPYMSMIGISVDAVDDELNQRIGRISKNGDILTIRKLQCIIDKVREINPEIIIKFNTVVNHINWDQKILSSLSELKPDKMKVFRQMPFKGQVGITDEQFATFIRNNPVASSELIIEDNIEMIHSYIMIDPTGRLFQNGNADKYYYSDKLQTVGLTKALAQITFNKQRFENRYRKEAYHEIR